MRCLRCNRMNETEAVFCSYCGIQMQPAPTIEPAEPVAEPLPATGNTIDLRQARRTQSAPRPVPAPQPVVPPPARPVPLPQRSASRRRHSSGSWGWWPLLLIIGIMSSMGNLSIILPNLAVPGLLLVLAWLAYQSNARRGRMQHARHVARVLTVIAVVVVLASWGVGFWPFFIFFWMIPFGRSSCRP